MGGAHTARLRARFEHEHEAYLQHELEHEHELELDARHEAHSAHTRRKFSAALAVASADEAPLPPLANADETQQAGRPYQLRRSVHPPPHVLHPTPEPAATASRALGRRSAVHAGGAASAAASTARAMRVKPEFVPPEWITSVQPRRTPYAPQIGDVVVYFHQGHRLYVNAVQSNNLFAIHQNALPWLKYPQLPVSASYS